VFLCFGLKPLLKGKVSMLLVDAWYHIKSTSKEMALEPFVWVRRDRTRDLLERCKVRDHLFFEDRIASEMRSNANLWTCGANRSSNPIESAIQAATRGTIKIGRTLEAKARFLFDVDNPDVAPYQYDALVFANLSVAKRWIKAALSDPRSARVLREATGHLSAARFAPGQWGPRPEPTAPVTMNGQLGSAAELEWDDAARLAQALFAGELLLLPVGISSLLYRAAWRRSSAGIIVAKSTSVEPAPLIAVPRRSPSAGQGSRPVRRVASKLPEPKPGKEQQCACLQQASRSAAAFVRL
jgi:hypothetical protein